MGQESVGSGEEKSSPWEKVEKDTEECEEEK